LKNLRKILITLAKVVGSLAIIGGLFYLALNTEDKRETFHKLIIGPKSWDLLAAGFLILLTAILITLIRWWYLVRALDIDFSLRDALRIGFLGYLFNLAPMGIVGGDLLKAWMLAREKPGSRAKGLASVIVDRIIGLYVLFLVASAGVFITGFWDYPKQLDPNGVVHWVCTGVLIITGVGTVGVAFMLMPGLAGGPLTEKVAGIPKIGPTLSSLLGAIKIYRTKRVVLFWASVATVPVHTLLTVSIFLLAWGLNFRTVPARDYLAVYPMSSILSTIPFPAGPQELGIVFLYKRASIRAAEGELNALNAKPDEPVAVPQALQDTAQQQGLILAMVYRLSTLLIAPIGAAYYFLGARKEVRDVMEHHDDAEPPAPD
jgi:uncharacterized membrane protein YbhN (UPF0104 family)